MCEARDNESVPQLPLFVTSIIGSGFVLTTAALLLGPDPTDHDVLKATGLIILGVVGLVGFLVTHGMWARRTLLATLGASLGVLALTPSSAWWWAAVATVGIGVYVTAGPPLDRWIRQLPPPEPLPVQALALPLVLLAVVLVAGVAELDTVFAVAWSVAAVGSAWAFGRAFVAGLWLARVFVPALGLLAASTAPSWWTALIAVATVGAGAWFAWSKQALLAVSPLEPKRVQPRPVFAEMAPDEVRRAAGIGRTGKRPNDANGTPQ